MPPPKNKGADDKPLGGIEKAALLLNALGDEATSNILKHLKDNDIRRILNMMSKMKKAPIPLIKSVLMDFYKSLSEESEVIFSRELTRIFTNKTRQDEKE